MSLIVDTTATALELAMDLRFRRQEMLSSNMANIDTPEYQPVDLVDEGSLKALPDESAYSTETWLTDRSHQRMGAAAYRGADRVDQRPDVFNSADGNGVDLDREVTRMADNSVRYNASIEMQRRRVGILNYTISQMAAG